MSSADYPKLSFRIAPPALEYVTDFARREGMTVSEALRYIIDVGREAIAREAYKPPTRGFMPRPTEGTTDGQARTETEPKRERDIRYRH